VQSKQEETDFINRRKLQDLLNQITQNAKLDTDVEELLVEIAEDFVEDVTKYACKLAKHRNANALEAKDLQLHLSTLRFRRVINEIEQSWGIFVPGFGVEAKRSAPMDDVEDSAHKARIKRLQQ
jgi:transcription initiation factor TFIID subunit 12